MLSFRGIVNVSLVLRFVNIQVGETAQILGPWIGQTRIPLRVTNFVVNND